jgi:hypothetical protein
MLAINAKAQVQSQLSLREICGGQSGIGTDFTPSTSVSPSQVLLHERSISFHISFRVCWERDRERRQCCI